MEQNFPEFLLQDLDSISEEIMELRRYGIDTMVDSMPIDAGRSGSDLTEIALRTNMHIVGATGLHLRLYYPPHHWYDTIDEDGLTARLIEEITEGMSDDGIRTDARAGVIKVAGSLDHLTDLEKRNFRAAGRAQAVTGCPILTHTEQGTAALEQVRVLEDSGANLSHVVLSHLDRLPDLAYQREVLRTGVKVEYDSFFRWKGEHNHTLELLLTLAPEFQDSFVLGMDAAKRVYWASFGGKPGLSFLVSTFVPKLRDAGLGQDLLDRILVRNPLNAYSFSTKGKGE
jgi:phosphotriesterase-related protein